VSRRARLAVSLGVAMAAGAANADTVVENRDENIYGTRL
jgi:hypothetical protein